MAKRTTAKHAKPKASIKKSQEKAAQSSSDSLSFSNSTKPSSAIGAEEGTTSASQDLNDASKTQVMPSNAAQVAQNAAPTSPKPADETAAMPAVNPGQAQAAPTPADQTTPINMATGMAAPTAFTSTAEMLNKKSARRRKTAKILGITSLSLVGAIAAVYLVGVFVFSTHFMPNTHISDMDLTMKTAQDLQSDFEEKVGNYTVKVKGNGLDLDVASADADLKVDSYGMAREIFSAQNPWAWPLEIIGDHDNTSVLTNFVSADSLSNLIKKEVKAINKNASDPTNAYCAFSPEQNKYVIIGEQTGTKLNYDAVMQSVLLGVMGLEELVVLDSSTLEQPKVLSTDERLAEVAKKANKLASTNLNIKMGGNQVTTVTAADVSKWIEITSKYKVKFNSDEMSKWVQELADSLNTVGSERTYKRPDGKKVTVSGGDYGWAINTDSLVSQLTTKIKNGAQEDVEVPVLQSGSGFSGIGDKDWGNRYIDIDISEQHAVFYDENSKVIWESDIVSGLPSGGRSTPQGVFDINLKGTNVTLIGRNSKGKVTYRTKVTYWMPFKDNAVGLHDATWQPSFGGNRYLYGGSHGCVNLPKSKAEELYGLIEVGDVVVVHS